MIDCKIVDHTKDGRCSQCGSCCTSFLPMTDYEVKTIKKYLKKHPVKEQRHNAMVGNDATCPFRDDLHRKCLIYEVRPFICREFMCNKRPDEVLANKIASMKMKAKVVFVRDEFFGNREDRNAFEDVAMAIGIVVNDKI